MRPTIITTDARRRELSPGTLRARPQRASVSRRVILAPAIGEKREDDSRGQERQSDERRCGNGGDYAEQASDGRGSLVRVARSPHRMVCVGLPLVRLEEPR
jgi:hypothetical protein